MLSHQKQKIKFHVEGSREPPVVAGLKTVLVNFLDYLWHEFTHLSGGMLFSIEEVRKQQDLIMHQSPQWHESHPCAPYTVFAVSVYGAIYLIY